MAGSFPNDELTIRKKSNGALYLKATKIHKYSAMTVCFKLKAYENMHKEYSIW